MPYTYYNTDERKRTSGSTLQAMAGMGLPKSYMSVILGKHQSSIYRPFNRNRSGGVYTGNEAQAMSEQRRLDNKPRPKTDDYALMSEITALFKKDLSPDQISGRWGTKYPGRPEKQASASTIYKHLYRETAEDPLLKDHFRRNRANEAAIADRISANPITVGRYRKPEWEPLYPIWKFTVQSTVFPLPPVHPRH